MTANSIYDNRKIYIGHQMTHLHSLNLTIATGESLCSLESKTFSVSYQIATQAKMKGKKPFRVQEIYL